MQIADESSQTHPALYVREMYLYNIIASTGSGRNEKRAKMWQT